mmetsp:Transcript_31678/g.48504  ORF Transcript_31678/g.48504 Transcript_31678/m.48504 type:complete len:223 (+) Transcript_31678:456-1124(+)
MWCDHRPASILVASKLPHDLWANHENQNRKDHNKHQQPTSQIGGIRRCVSKNKKQGDTDQENLNLSKNRVENPIGFRETVVDVLGLASHERTRSGGNGHECHEWPHEDFLVSAFALSVRLSSLLIDYFSFPSEGIEKRPHEEQRNGCERKCDEWCKYMAHRHCAATKLEDLVDSPKLHEKSPVYRDVSQTNQPRSNETRVLESNIAPTLSFVTRKGKHRQSH